MHTQYTSYPVVALTDGGQTEGEFYLRAPLLKDEDEAYGFDGRWGGEKGEIILLFEQLISIAEEPGDDAHTVVVTGPRSGDGEGRQSRFDAGPRAWLDANDPLHPQGGPADAPRTEKVGEHEVEIVSIAVARGAMRELMNDALQNEFIARIESGMENFSNLEKASVLRRMLKLIERG